MIFDIVAAYEFYRNHILNETLLAILLEYNQPIAGSVSAVRWQCFGAILTNDRGNTRYGGHDLECHEIKSALDGRGFEYQYHKASGRAKLAAEIDINHIFISYSPNYHDVTVRLASGWALKEAFTSWVPDLIAAYADGRTQRFRRELPVQAINGNCSPIMRIENKNLLYATRMPHILFDRAAHDCCLR